MKGFCLEYLLECLQIPFKLIRETDLPALSLVHVAGNDAKFTLKGLLEMMVSALQGSILSPAYISTFPSFNK
jgi:hypothetical protein